MHSHAGTQKSSWRISAVPGRGKGGFRAGGRRNVLRASEAVRATDVMVNKSESLSTYTYSSIISPDKNLL